MQYWLKCQSTNHSRLGLKLTQSVDTAKVNKSLRVDKPWASEKTEYILTLVMEHRNKMTPYDILLYKSTGPFLTDLRSFLSQ